FWSAGGKSTFPLTITQSGANATGTVGGVTGGAAAIYLGSASLNGTVSGHEVDLKLFGTTSHTQNGCAYTINAELTGSLAQDTLNGKVLYTSKTNGSPDCGAIEGCMSQQDFNAVRPPSP